MSAIDRLLSNYSRQVRLPWSANISGKQRVWLAVYPPAEERRVRAHLPQFEALTLEAKHGWTTVDLTRLLPEWISDHEYREVILRHCADSRPPRVAEARTLRASGILQTKASATGSLNRHGLREKHVCDCLKLNLGSFCHLMMNDWADPHANREQRCLNERNRHVSVCASGTSQPDRSAPPWLAGNSDRGTAACKLTLGFA